MTLTKVTVTESKRGGRVALLDGFKYNQRKINQTGSIQWRCRIVGCNASITTDASFVVMRGDTTHTHDKQQNGHRTQTHKTLQAIHSS